MKTKKIVILIALLMLCVTGALADGTKSLRLSEVAIGDSAHGGPWIEIENISWGTQNLGGFYITNDPAVFNQELTAPERIKKMHLIPTGNPITQITPQNCLLLYADGHDNLGIQHMDFTLQPGDVVALYNGNGVDLIDSVTIPTDIKASQSYAIDFAKKTWSICNEPTPTLANDYKTAKQNNKIAEFKEKDPYGFAMSILAMGVVFGCLILLYVFFSIFGRIAKTLSSKAETTPQPKTRPVKPGSKHKHSKHHSSKESEEEVAAMLAVTQATAGSGDEELDVALIALTLDAELAHDDESGVITIQERPSEWTDKASLIAAGMLK